jgi:hypothetical protein
VSASRGVRAVPLSARNAGPSASRRRCSWFDAEQDSVTDQPPFPPRLYAEGSRRDGCCFDHMLTRTTRSTACDTPPIAERLARALTNLTPPMCPSGLRRDLQRPAR